jgi:hypothetical protein
MAAVATMMPPLPSDIYENQIRNFGNTENSQGHYHQLGYFKYMALREQSYRVDKNSEERYV